MSRNQDFQCLVCHCIVRDCRTTSCCGALLCGDCANHSIVTASCPQCRRGDVRYVENPAMQRVANTLDVECDDCGQTHKHSEMHQDWCPEGWVQCHFEFLACPWEGKRKDVGKHLKECHSPKCPHGHIMFRSTMRFPSAFCDVCGQGIGHGMPLYVADDETEGDIDCDYVECPGCFSHRTIRSLAPGCTVGGTVPGSEEEGSKSDDSDESVI